MFCGALATALTWQATPTTPAPLLPPTLPWQKYAPAVLGEQLCLLPPPAPKNLASTLPLPLPLARLSSCSCCCSCSTAAAAATRRPNICLVQLGIGQSFPLTGKLTFLRFNNWNAAACRGNASAIEVGFQWENLLKTGMSDDQTCSRWAHIGNVREKRERIKREILSAKKIKLHHKH